MKKKLQIISWFFILLISTGINAQNTKPLINSKLNGIVIDKESKSPITGATVKIKGTTHSVITDGEGKFYFQTGQKFPYALAIEGLRAITINGAYEYFEENSKGSIEKGKLADLVILSDDLTTINPSKIKDIVVLETIKEGKIIFKKNK
jgi:predicted amidohydrolase YtcJ